MTFDELKDKALSLPLAPGVYIMRNKDDKVIYVGKAKKLKNRVSQYFQNTANHTPKTRLMVSHIDHFDVIVAASEFEALVLECSLIKQHQPKYNILLKDGKGYPFIRVDQKEPFPVISVAGKVMDDGAQYFGPFGSRGMTQSAIDAIRTTLQLPVCSKRFPQDIGKGRPCLHFHMNQCKGWCAGKATQQQYRDAIQQACQLLSGNYKKVASHLRSRMLKAAEDMQFELAAELRDRLNAVEALGKKQLVAAGAAADTDVIGFACAGTKACFAVLHYRGGSLLDKEYEILSAPEDPATAISALVKQFYLSRGFAPKVVLLPTALEDGHLIPELLSQHYEKKIYFRVPKQGDNARLVEMAQKNALEEVQRITSKDEQISGILQLLGKMLSIQPPKRIESYDISNISGTDIVASMVVFEDGKPKKTAYRHFKIEGLTGQDDYGSMRQVLLRRFRHYLDGDAGFEQAPDLLLIDGGLAHAGVALEALRSLDLQFPIVGMVKDDRHRTRALVTPQGSEISIVTQQSVFALVGNIQEETHRFAITYHRKLRNKRLHYSVLDQIPGIGPKRKQELLKAFKSIRSISEATVPELERYLPANTAAAVFAHFHPEESEDGT